MHTPVRFKQPARLCSTPSCRRIHHRFGPWCGHCTSRRVRTGHPEGVILTKNQVRQWLPLIRQLLDQHRDKKAIKAAVVWSAKMLDARGSHAVHFELHRLKSAGVSPQEFLETIGAVYAYAHHDPRALPDDARLTHNLANAILRLRPSQRRYSASGRGYTTERQTSKTRRELGETLRSAVGPIFMQLLARHEADQEAERELREDLKTPIIEPSH